MTSLHFENLEEFTTLFRQKNKEVSDAIRLGVERAMMDRKRTAEPGQPQPDSWWNV